MSKKTIAVFGGGIAGLTAAHEFACLGCEVHVYETNENVGGFFRSARLKNCGNMPTEYSWHGYGPWYHNAFDIMRQIPFDDSASLYERSLSRPIDFGIAPDQGEAQFINSSPLRATPRLLRFKGGDFLSWAWLLLKTWTTNRRSLDHYSTINAAEAFRPFLSRKAWMTWRATFGPWIGSDWTKVSLHTMGDFYRKLLLTKPSHQHPADDHGPAWQHGQGDNWLLLRGPSNEYWFDKWVVHLDRIGVRFFKKESLQQLDYADGLITAAHFRSGKTVNADVYVLAVNPFAAAEILSRTPSLARQDQLCLFTPLIQDGPHTQVSCRIAFAEKIHWPRRRAAVIIADSEFNLTLCPEEEVWDQQVDLGEGVKSLWTVTACVCTEPGRLFGKPVVTCTKEEFIAEVKAQVYGCQGLDKLIRQANQGRSLQSFPILHFEIWYEWEFSAEGIKTHQLKWVNSTATKPFRPTQATPVANLVLAGAHTRTQADVWSIEGAVESGRRAAQVIEPSVKVLPQYDPWWLRFLGRLDDCSYVLGGPHILTLVVTTATILLVVVLFTLFF